MAKVQSRVARLSKLFWKCCGICLEHDAVVLKRAYQLGNYGFTIRKRAQGKIYYDYEIFTYTIDSSGIPAHENYLKCSSAVYDSASSAETAARKEVTTIILNQSA